MLSTIGENTFNIFSNPIKKRSEFTNRPFIEPRELKRLLQNRQGYANASPFVICVGNFIVLNTVSPNTAGQPFKIHSLSKVAEASSGDSKKPSDSILKLLNEFIESDIYIETWKEYNFVSIVNGMMKSKNGPEFLNVFPPSRVFIDKLLKNMETIKSEKIIHDEIILSRLVSPQSTSFNGEIPFVVSLINHLLFVYTFKKSITEFVKCLVIFRHAIGCEEGIPFFQKYTKIWGKQGAGKSTILVILQWFLCQSSFTSSIKGGTDYNFSSGAIYPFRIVNEAIIKKDDEKIKRTTTDPTLISIEVKNNEAYQIIVQSTIFSTSDNGVDCAIEEIVPEKEKERRAYSIYVNGGVKEEYIQQILDSLFASSYIRDIYVTQFASICDQLEKCGSLTPINISTELPYPVYNEASVDFLRTNEMNWGISNKKTHQSVFSLQIETSVMVVIEKILETLNFFPVDDPSQIICFFTTCLTKYTSECVDTKVLRNILLTTECIRTYTFVWGTVIKSGTSLVLIFEKYHDDIRIHHTTYRDKINSDYFNVIMNALYINPVFRQYFGINESNGTTYNYHGYSGKKYEYPGHFIPSRFTVTSFRLLILSLIERYHPIPGRIEKTYDSDPISMMNGVKPSEDYQPKRRKISSSMVYDHGDIEKSISIIAHNRFGLQFSISAGNDQRESVYLLDPNNRGYNRQLGLNNYFNISPNTSPPSEFDYKYLDNCSKAGRHQIRFTYHTFRPYHLIKQLYLYRSMNESEINSIFSTIEKRVYGIQKDHPTGNTYGTFDEEKEEFTFIRIPEEKIDKNFCASVGSNLNSEWENMDERITKKEIPIPEKISEFYTLYKIFIKKEQKFSCDSKNLEDFIQYLLNLNDGFIDVGDGYSEYLNSKSEAITNGLDEFNKLFS